MKLQARRPLPHGLRSDPVTLGEHLRRFRFDHGLSKSDVRRAVGASFEAVARWERGELPARLAHVQALHDLLGICPLDDRVTRVGAHLKRWRKERALTAQQAAEELGICRTTVERLEVDRFAPQLAVRRRLEAVGAIPLSPVAVALSER